MTGPAKINYVNANYTYLYFYEYLFFEMSMHFLSTSEDSPLNSTSMVLILFNSYKWIISYDRANLKKVGNFYVLTWLNFAGLVTFT